MTRKVIVVREENRDGAWRVLKYSAIAAAGLITVGGLGVILARDQMSRHQRDLFSPHPLRRLAALGYMRGRPAVDNVLLLRDYLAWEERPMLRKKAAAILGSMEEILAAEAEGA